MIDVEIKSLHKTAQEAQENFEDFALKYINRAKQYGEVLYGFETVSEVGFFEKVYLEGEVLSFEFYNGYIGLPLSLLNLSDEEFEDWKISQKQIIDSQKEQERIQKLEADQHKEWLEYERLKAKFEGVTK